MTHSSAFVPAHGGIHCLESTLVFLEQRAKLKVCVSALAELDPGHGTPGEVVFARAALILCSISAPLTAPLLPWHRCALSPADALQPWASHLLEQMLIFVFQGKMHAMLEPWTDGRKGSPLHTFPISS